MTTKELAALASKITGIVLIVIAMSRLPIVVRQFIQSFYAAFPGAGLMPLSTGCSLAVLLTSGIVLLAKGDKFGGLLAKTDTPITASFESDAYVAIGTVLVGIWLMATALPVAI